MTLTHDPPVLATQKPSLPWSFSAAELKAHAANNPPPLIGGLLPSAGVVTFAGEPGVGKSFTALSWAACVAQGVPWFGHVVRDPLPVVYVLGEGWSAFGRRVQAWEDVHGQQIDERLRFVDGAALGLDLADPGKVDEMTEELSRLSPALVVFDTFSMLAHVRSENDNAEVAAVFAVAHRLVRELGCTVVLVHHVSKGEKQVRGATAFRGNADTVVTAARSSMNDGTFIISTRPEDDGKQRDFEPVRLAGFSIAAPGVLTRSTPVAQAGLARDAMSELMASLGEGVNDEEHC